MLDIGIVYGSEEQAKPVVVGKDTVYVHTDITEVTNTDERGNTTTVYQYNEVQYDKDDYIDLVCEKNASLEAQATEAQEALCELYELLSVE